MFKRKTAHKVWIETINRAKPIYDAGKFIGVSFNNKKIQRVNIIGTVIDKFTKNGFGIITIDDSSGNIEVREFEKGFEGIEIGNVVLVIGRLKTFNEKIYIAKEIIKKLHPLWLVARKLELEKIFGLKLSKERYVYEGNTEVKNESNDIKNKVFEKIKKIEQENGEVNVEELFLELKAPIDEIKKAISNLIDEGKIYEPRPGILKVF